MENHGLDPSKSPRPAVVTTLATIWIVVGLKLALFGISALQIAALLIKGRGWPQVVHVIVAVSILQTPVSAMGFIAGVNLLNRREWARLALEVVNWIMFLILLILSMYLLFSYTSYRSSLGWDANGVLAVIFGMLSGMVVISLPVVFISYLQSEPVRQAMVRDH